MPVRAGSVALLVLLAAPAARPLDFEDPASIVAMMCGSVAGPTGEFPHPVDETCERDVVSTTVSGNTKARAAIAFEPPTATAFTDCAECPFAVTTRSSARLSFQLTVAALAAPPAPVTQVPVRVAAQGIAEVSLLGMLAAASTYVSTTERIPFSNWDVFGALALTRNAPNGGTNELEVSYDVVETIDLTPGSVYFADVVAGCNDSLSGSWVCSADATASFVLDQAAFDERMGAGTFALAEFFVVQTSLVPEPSAHGLASAALGALAGACRLRPRR